MGGHPSRMPVSPLSQGSWVSLSSWQDELSSPYIGKTSFCGLTCFSHLMSCCEKRVLVQYLSSYNCRFTQSRPSCGRNPPTGIDLERLLELNETFEIWKWEHGWVMRLVACGTQGKRVEQVTYVPACILLNPALAFRAARRQRPTQSFTNAWQNLISKNSSPPSSPGRYFPLCQRPHSNSS